MPPCSGSRPPRAAAGWLEALKPGCLVRPAGAGELRFPLAHADAGTRGVAGWAGRLDGVLRHDDAVAEPAEYLEIMLDAGCAADAWETTYLQLLPGRTRCWSGSGDRPAAGPGCAPPEDEAVEFEAEYAAQLDNGLPRRAHGTVFPFRRIFAVAGNGGPAALEPAVTETFDIRVRVMGLQ